MEIARRVQRQPAGEGVIATAFASRAEMSLEAGVVDPRRVRNEVIYDDVAIYADFRRRFGGHEVAALKSRA